mmetsp:Transcript_116505/g.206233  ORF Transcript_116505/g.206233 Transcript_116505/m.206233 type:complete len:303 (-) Transcript_116505:20-928(-)
MRTIQLIVTCLFSGVARNVRDLSEQRHSQVEALSDLLIAFNPAQSHSFAAHFRTQHLGPSAKAKMMSATGKSSRASLSRRGAIASGLAAALAPLVPAQADTYQMVPELKPRGDPNDLDSRARGESKLGMYKGGQCYGQCKAPPAYLPYIFRAWVAANKLAEPCLEKGDWASMKIVQKRIGRCDLLLFLFADAVEGERALKRPIKTATQKKLFKLTDRLTLASADLKAAVKKKDVKACREALYRWTTDLERYYVIIEEDPRKGGGIPAKYQNMESITYEDQKATAWVLFNSTEIWTLDSAKIY